MEFVKNKSKGKKYSIYVIEKLKELGYNVCGDIIDFSEYGIPQKRNRFILVGVRIDIVEKNKKVAEDFFEQIKINKKSFLVNHNLSLNVNLEEAISDLLMINGTAGSPDTKSFKAGLYSGTNSSYQKYMRQGLANNTIADSHRFVNHRQDIVARFKMFLKNETRNKTISDTTKDYFGLKKRTQVPLNAKLPSPTITTLPDDYIHYLEPRILTVREYARIQSFPDTYEFKGKYTTGGKRRIQEVPRYTQIGNAIPPLFGEQSGLVLKQILNNE
jgi:DNA (cytosine-5)-methyltransferase 1